MIERLERLPGKFPAARRWVVAYSGGRDSHVLLHLCSRFLAGRGEATPSLVALHVDHGAQQRSADWARHCALTCSALGVEFALRHGPARDGSDSEARVAEDTLRSLRYALFADFCRADDLLLLAHHRDDQAETVLFRLLRGAGVRGLSGMPRSRPIGAATLSRPLLEVSGAQIAAYAEQHRLEWIDDPSNADPSYTRNYLRHLVMPGLEQRWPGARDRMAQSASHCREAVALADELAHMDLVSSCESDRFATDMLRLDAWRALGQARARNLLRAWLAHHGAGRVEVATLQTLERELIGARPDSRPELRVGANVLLRFRDRLYAIGAQSLATPAPDHVEIRPGAVLDLGAAGRVELLTVREGGCRSGSRCEIRFAAPGLRFKAPGRPRRAVRRILQENAVPPWLRDRVPLLFVDDEPAALADLCVSEQCAAVPGEAALALRWWPATGRFDARFDCDG